MSLLILKTTVIPGRQVGRRLGFPTLNFKINKEVRMPEFGIYVGYVNKMPAVFNYGPRKTFGLTKPFLEAHLLDFSGEWREKAVEIELVSYLREVKKFETEEKLKEQIRRDIEQAKKQLFSE